MAKRHSTLKARAGLKLSTPRDAHAANNTAVLRGSAFRRHVPPGPCRRTIETERTRLMKAEAVLGSLAFALDHAEWRTESGTDYANVIQAVHEIVRESIRQLDSIGMDQPTSA